MFTVTKSVSPRPPTVPMPILGAGSRCQSSVGGSSSCPLNTITILNGLRLAYYFEIIVFADELVDADELEYNARTTSSEENITIPTTRGSKIRSVLLFDVDARENWEIRSLFVVDTGKTGKNVQNGTNARKTWTKRAINTCFSW